MNKFFVALGLAPLLLLAACGDDSSSGGGDTGGGAITNPDRLAPGHYSQSALSIPTALDDPYLSVTAPWSQPLGASAVPYLWSYNDLGVFGEYAKLALPAREIVVAIVDTGIDKDHPDIAGRLWMNPGESSDDKYANGVDDDGDGFVDDFLGWDFVHNTNNPADDNGHGSHLAGTIGAIGGNGQGLVGVAPWVRLMAIKACDSMGSCDSANLRAGIAYAVEHGAKIINLSVGEQDVGADSDAFDQAITDATDAGALVFAAAGNSSTDASQMSPANATYAMAIAAHRNDGQLCSFSDTGFKVDLSGPGCGFDGTFETNGILSLNSSKCGAGGNQYCSTRLAVDTQYARKAGTSMATPHGAGLAAVAWTASPDATPLQIRQALLRVARKSQAGSVSKLFGMGRMSGTNIYDEARTAPGIKITNRYGSTADTHQIGMRIEARANAVSWKLSYIGGALGNDVSLTSGTQIAASATDVGPGEYVTITQPWSPPAAGSYLVVLEATSNGQTYYDVTMLNR